MHKDEYSEGTFIDKENPFRVRISTQNTGRGAFRSEDKRTEQQDKI